MAALHRVALPVPPRAIGRPRAGRLLLAATAAVVIAAAVFQVNQFSRLTSTSYQINQLNRERALHQAENHGLEAEVARLSSLARVDWEARVRLHMQPAERRLYISVNQPVPERQTLPTRFLPAAVAAEASPSDTWWRRLWKLLPFF